MAAPRLPFDEALTFKVSIVLNQAENDRLEQISKLQNRSKSFVIRSAFKFYLAAHEEKA